jgi:tRNA threonylcarbamoyladenosine biosynthesis protein TsaB
VARADDMAKGQAEHLPAMVAGLLADEGVAWPDITFLAVGTGPGNFTGIRIAVAYVRGLALGLGVQAKGVTAFQAVAMAHGSTSLPHWVVIDAPRGAHYAQRFPDGEAAILAADALAGLDAPVLHHRLIGPKALVSAIAQQAFHTPTDALLRPAPFYLRGADAAPPSDLPPVILP